MLTDEVDDRHEADEPADGGLDHVGGQRGGGVAEGALRGGPPGEGGPPLRPEVAVPVHGQQRVGEAPREGQPVAGHHGRCRMSQHG